MRRLSTLSVLLPALAVLLALLPSRAVAAVGDQPADLTAEQLARILTSPDPEAGMKALTPDQVEDASALLADGLKATGTVVASGALTVGEARSLGLNAPARQLDSAAAAASGCWYHYYFSNWTLYSATVASSWMQLNWCGSRGSITSHSISNVGGNGTGVSYQGSSRSTRNVGWEVRGLTTHRWDFWVGGFSKCMQIRGGATGLYSRSVSCNLG